MSEQRDFNPIEASRRIEESYREYIATTIHFADADLQGQLESILHEPGYLSKGPFLEAAPPYTKDKTVRELVGEGVLCRSMLQLGGGSREKFDPDRPLYVHQVRAIRKAAEGRNYAVVTGTGSGKTECFLLPILNDILREFEVQGPSSGVRAMILYPMNALANDQLKRMRELLAGTPITFGRYTGDTQEEEPDALSKWNDENPGQVKLPNEIISRERIRREPPNILLTNYAMLEYLLLRPSDAPLFGSALGSNWRHIVVDEAHVYSGSLGTEIAYLLRRLKARITNETGNPLKLHCYATSATIGTEKDMPKVARFAQDLFGEPFDGESDDIDVITSSKDDPQSALDASPWGCLPLEAWPRLRSLVKNPEDLTGEEIERCLSEFRVPSDVSARIKGKAPLLGLGSVLLGEESTRRLVRRCESLLDLTNPGSIDELGIPGLTDDAAGIETLTAMVEVLSAAQRSLNVPILSSRYHSFLRAPEGLYINLATRRLTPHKRVEEVYRGSLTTPVYEVSVCRHCGQTYVLGKETSHDEAKCAWLNPRHEGTDAGDEFLPRTYYRVLPLIDEADEDEVVEWLCPICGSISGNEDADAHLYEHEQIGRVPIAKNESEDKQADELVARCRHCGYQSNVAIQPMRVSPEAAGSVVCYDLVREIPPFDSENETEGDDLFGDYDEPVRAGNVICFSDKRQDAAFFAPAMERTYGAITRRQLIREAVESRGESGCTPSAVINWIVSNANRKYPGILAGDKEALAEAWVIDELEAEDSRNSLDGLGVIKVEPTEVYGRFSEDIVVGAVVKQMSKLPAAKFGWMTTEDYILVFKVCLETLRERGAIEVSAVASELRTGHQKRANVVVRGSVSGEACDGVIGFAGSARGTENKRSAFVRRYARKVRGVQLEREDATDLLKNVFDFMRIYLKKCFRGDGLIIESGNGFVLNKDIWRLMPSRPTDTVYRCKACGCESHLDTNGVCVTAKCEGGVVSLTTEQAASKDRFYKTTYRQDPLPVVIEEHTAQLSSKRAREVQSAFIKGDVNVLSCTTTFELGVDVGDLRAIFMRNIPPTTANYTQRAGRVGRRAGKPGFAVTFARLRPHDVAHFANPEHVIAGATRVPVVYMDNSSIALRHVFAIALSEFFRFSRDAYEIDCSHGYDAFMALDEVEPEGLMRLRNYLSAKPETVSRQIADVVPADLSVYRELGVENWGWVDELIAPASDTNAGGRLVRTHELKQSDYALVRRRIGMYITESDEDKAARLLKISKALKSERTIAVLAENGILPKYGFPTDLVSLQTPDKDIAGDSRLTLERGLRQAIYEYAPSNEIVAGKKLWRTVGFRVPWKRELIKRAYGRCEECDTFVCPIDTFADSTPCPVCGIDVALKKKMLIPAYGFRAVEVKKGIGLRKPRAKGCAKVYFSQKWPNETQEKKLLLRGGEVLARYVGNGQLCALNAPKQKFSYCFGCNSAWLGGTPEQHFPRCKKQSCIGHLDALGTTFVSDIVGLTFTIPGSAELTEDGWTSVMWALFTAATNLLELPEMELGGTMRADGIGGMEVMIYDNVPGGAGHAEQLFGMVDELIREAYKVVDGHCGCGGETCCYGCIANYQNQSVQAQLSRQAAKDLLGALLGVEEGEAPNRADGKCHE